MQENEIVTARVTTVHEHGLDIEAEGRRGFVQPIELTWFPEEAGPRLAPGDSIPVFVYAVTPTCFFASIRQARPEENPWKDPSVYAVGSLHRGKIDEVREWCCLVEIARGVWGTILLDKYPGSYPIGQVVEVEVVLQAGTRLDVRPRR